MTRVLLHLPAIPKPDDTADALAMAITFCHTNGSQLNRFVRSVPGLSEPSVAFADSSLLRGALWRKRERFTECQGLSYR